MKLEDASKLNELISEVEKLRSRSPEESKFKDWKDKTEKKLEELFGRGSEPVTRFKGVGFFDFSRRPAKEAPLSEEERSRFLRGLEEARRLLIRFKES